MRKYSIDANRNLSDLKLKVLCNFEYNNLLLSCYDTAFLFLSDLYFPNKSQYPDVDDVNLYTVVRALSSRSHFLTKTISGYDRLYFIYELVYRNYFEASKSDIVAALRCLNKIVTLWWKECSWPSLIELASFVNHEKTEEYYSMQDNDYSRQFIAKDIGLYDCLSQTIALLEGTDG